MKNNEYVVLEGPSNGKDEKKIMSKAIRRTQKVNKPMKNVSRIIIQTDEENPKVIAVVTNDDFEVADGYAIRQKPVYPDKKVEGRKMKPAEIEIRDLKKESAEVLNKLMNLDDFLQDHEGGLEYEQKRLLRVQRTILRSYYEVLKQRIYAFKAEKD